MIEPTFIACVLAQSAITAIIGEDDDARFYNRKLPQKPVYPCATFTKISGPRDYTQTGADGVVTFRLQVDCFGETAVDAAFLKGAFAGSLSGLYNQSFGSPPVTIQGIFIADDRATVGEEMEEPGPSCFIESFDLFVTIKSA